MTAEERLSKPVTENRFLNFKLLVLFLLACISYRLADFRHRIDAIDEKLKNQTMEARQ